MIYFRFSFSAPPAAQTAPKAEEKDEEEESDEPPKVEVKTVVEEDSLYSVRYAYIRHFCNMRYLFVFNLRCKLFYKLDKEFKEKGLGMLHLKSIEDSDKTQMVIRAETNLGNILLNILLNDKMMFKATKNNIMFMCVPNPEIKGTGPGPVSMLIKVKAADVAEELVSKIKEQIEK